MARGLQPEIVINDRLPGAGDYDTPEQFVPPVAPGRPWEVCMTMNDSWGYNPADTAYKSARSLVHTLCEIAGRGGRLLLNLSPRGDGTLPPEQTERLREVGGWLARNGSSVGGTSAGLEPWQYYGPSTQQGDTIYLHLLMRPYDSLKVRGIPIRRVVGVKHLATGRDLAFTTRCAILDELLNSDPMGELTIEVPEDILDPCATVIAVEVRDRS